MLLSLGIIVIIIIRVCVCVCVRCVVRIRFGITRGRFFFSYFFFHFPFSSLTDGTDVGTHESQAGIPCIVYHDGEYIPTRVTVVAEREVM